MTPDQIPQLIAEIALADPRVQRDSEFERRAQVKMWAGILADVPRDFAVHAAQRHYATSQYPILPADIAAAWVTQIRDRMGRHTDPTPTVDPDDVAAYQAQLRADRAAVVQGERAPAPQIAARGPSGPLLAALEQVGQRVDRPYAPQHAREALAAVMPRRAAREALRAEGGIDPLSVRCPACHAPENEQCRRRRQAKGGGWARMSGLHPSRIEAVVVPVACCPACQVEPGVPCHDGGRPRDRIHVQRLAAAVPPRGVEAS